MNQISIHEDTHRGRRGLRIGIDARPALWPRTGIGTIVEQVLQRIGSFDANNTVIAYFDQDPAAQMERFPGIEHRFGRARHELLWSNFVLAPGLRRDRIDILVSFLDREVPIVPIPCKVISTIHDLIPMQYPETVFRNLLHRVYYMAAIRWSAWRADVIMTNSEFSRREVVEGLGLPESKVRPIALGYGSTQEPQQDIDNVLAQYGGNTPYLMALGGTEPRKNNLGVLKAFHRLRDRWPGLQLLIAGGKWRGLSFPEDLLDDRVRALGYVPDAALSALMQSAEAFVFPSFHEGFGFPVLEAMSLGIPVITSCVSALPEVGGDAALYVDPESVDQIEAAMERVLSDAHLRDDLSRRGREWAATYSWQNCVRDILALCNDVAGRP